MRIRVALRTAERLGFFPESPSDNRNVPVSVIYEQLQKYKSLVESDTDQRALNSTFELKLAYGFVSRCLDQAIDSALFKIGEAKLQVSTLNLELPKLVERIDMRLPPNEYFDGGKNIVADPRSALNAGWVAWLGEQKKHGCPGNKGISGLEKINQLTMKAVEYICLQQEWNEAQLLNGGEPQ